MKTLLTEDLNAAFALVRETLPTLETILAQSHSVAEFNCAVYFLISEDTVVYVGQSTNAMSRIGTHVAERFKTFDSFTLVPCPLDMLEVVEGSYIKKFSPRYNVLGNAGRPRITPSLERLSK